MSLKDAEMNDQHAQTDRNLSEVQQSNDVGSTTSTVSSIEFLNPSSVQNSPNKELNMNLTISEEDPMDRDKLQDDEDSDKTIIEKSPDEPIKSPSNILFPSRSSFLPWSAYNRNMITTNPIVTSSIENFLYGDTTLRPGEIVMRTLFHYFTQQAEKKIELVMLETYDKNVSKLLQRGENPAFDQLLSALGSMAEHCLPSLLRALIAWHTRQLSDTEIRKLDNASKHSAELESQVQRREAAVEFIFCLALLEVLKQLPFHPGHEDLIRRIEHLAFRHFKFREGIQNSPNACNIHMIADLYAEVIGVLAQSRFQSVKKRFMQELKELRSKEPSPYTTQSIISLLMGMKFFRVKMVPIEEFEASFHFMHECGQYFLEVKDKDVKHALAGLFVEILVPVAAAVKNEVNVPCVKNFVELLYSPSLDACTKSKHRLALFPLVTCLLCVSQKTFFLNSWHYFLAMCLSNLKNRDQKMNRVALESLYRLLWVYMIRIKCESNQATHSRLQSIVNSLFPRGSKSVVPRDTPLNIFVKIIQFIAQERLDFAMKEIVFELLCVGRQIKIITTPERMSIGLRAFLVVADNLQQKDGEPPMPRTVGVLPSGNTLRVKKTFLNKMLTEDAARSIGMSNYFPHVRAVFVDILRALDVHYGRPLMITTVQSLNKEPDEMLAGERKPKIDLFRTCVAAIPRLIPETMNGHELVDMLARLTIHVDEELKVLACQSLQTLVMDFSDWRQNIIQGFTHFLARDIPDTFPQLLDNGLRLLLNLLTVWKTAVLNGNLGNKIETVRSTQSASSSSNPPQTASSTSSSGNSSLNSSGVASISTNITAIETKKPEQPITTTFHLVEGFALMMLCNCRPFPRKYGYFILKEVKTLLKLLNVTESEPPLLDAIDNCCSDVLEKCYSMLSQKDKSELFTLTTVDLHWLTDRNGPIWTVGYVEDNVRNSTLTLCPAQSSSVQFDAWGTCLFGFMEKSRVVSQCPSVCSQAWPLLYHRVLNLYSVIDPTPVNDNRASLLRSSAPTKKPPPENQRDALVHLWKNQVAMAFILVPPMPNIAIRCASPDLSLSSSPDSLTTDRSEKSDAVATPAVLYKKIVPLLRCEVPDIRDAAVNAIGIINPDALKDLMEELLVYIREAIDRKQENMRRRRRRDVLRLQLIKVLEKMAENRIFGSATNMFDRDNTSLHPSLVEYIDGARLYLEMEVDKDNVGIKEVKVHFCNYIHKMIKNFSLETCNSLISKDLKRNLFNLFATWSGVFARHLETLTLSNNIEEEKLQFSALRAMCTLLCCGPCFDTHSLSEDGNIYPWLDLLLTSKNEKVYDLAKITVIHLLEANPDIGQLLEWVIDRCFTALPREADACFLSLAAIFCAKEYPCDHYTSVINVTLLMTGCPRAEIHSTALQLLQILDKRFFGNIGLLQSENEQEIEKFNTLDTILSGSYCRSQMFLSRQMARLRPELTMPMFSEITHRFQTARSEVRALLLRGLLPWLENMELVATSVPPATPLSYIMYYPNSGTSGRREGSGSTEATEMILNNLFYITVKFADSHPRETEELWGTICQFWPNNLKVVLRYLVIISGMAPTELLPYAKRVALYMARSCPDRLLDEIMTELQTVETLNCFIERTETPPFYRLTSIRKASSHSEGTTTGNNDSKLQDGTIHTKRHSGEEPIKSGTCKSDSALRTHMSSYRPPRGSDKLRTSSGPAIFPRPEDVIASEVSSHEDSMTNKPITITPHPLPMPEYGGWFAPLTEFLPDLSTPISGFHRCNVAVMLLVDIVVDGIEGIDWTLHVPLMLHILVLGLDHTRPIVRDHCKQLLLHLLIVLCDHDDHLTVAKVLLNSENAKYEIGLSANLLSVLTKNFTEPNPEFESYLQGSPAIPPPVPTQATNNEPVSALQVPKIVTEGNISPQPDQTITTPLVIKSLIQFLANTSCQSLWNYEDITAKVWSIKSASQLTNLLQYVLKVFTETYPQSRFNERWAQTALQLGLSCSSRHYAGRSLQVFRALNIPINSRMLSDILSRLVETVAEQGEDMQGYVTELLLTLEAAVDSLDSDFRPLDVMKDIFKSTPNLNNKDGSAIIAAGKKPNNEPGSPQTINSLIQQQGHTRSTSYSVSYCTKRTTQSPIDKQLELRNRRSAMDNELQKLNGALSRSRSAQSLKQLGDSATQDDKMTILAQLFWLAVSLLESDFEHEYSLALRLLNRVLIKLPLDRPDSRDKIEKLQSALKWVGFPGVQALLLKGCTHSTTYESSVVLLSKLTSLLNLPVCDPTQSCGFPLNVIALLPYMLLHYEDANEVCVASAENIAQVAAEMGSKLENLGTVMTLYSRKTFCKESFQWTKCVVKYVHDTYAHLGVNMLAFLLDILEKGWAQVQGQVLSVIHCMLHYVDLSTQQAQPLAADILKVISKFLDSPHWRESLKILKLVVTRSSSLQVVPQYSRDHSFFSSFSDSELFCKKELAGRTMDFTFDVSQTPLIGRRLLLKGETESQAREKASALNLGSSGSPRRSASLSPADTGPISGWKRPWTSQSRVRECLVNLLNACGQRVGLPKSPSVIFSQTSDILERQSSAASSTDETSGNQNDLSGGSRRDDQPDFAVFKDFDFLEYESESMGGDSTDNFWGVRRRPLSQSDGENLAESKNVDESLSESTPVLTKRAKRPSHVAEDSSDEENDNETPMLRKSYLKSAYAAGPPTTLSIKERHHRRDSVSRSDTSGSSVGDLGDITPCNESPHVSGLLPFRVPIRDESEEIWRRNLKELLLLQHSHSPDLLDKLYLLIKELSMTCINIAKESNKFFTGVSTSLGHRISVLADLLSSRGEPPKIWYNKTIMATPRLQESLRYAILEVQEHLETFFDRKDLVNECLDSVKVSCKYTLFSDMESSNEGSANTLTSNEQTTDQAAMELLIDLGRALYKLMFQLLLLIESDHKIAINITQSLRRNDKLRDLTKVYISVRGAILRSIDEAETESVDTSTSTEGDHTPTPSPGIPMNNNEFESMLIELIDSQRWTKAINHVKQHKRLSSATPCFTLATGNLETASSIPKDEDMKSVADLNIIMDIYSQRLIKDREDVFIISRPEAELNEIHQILIENLYQVSSALAGIEINIGLTAAGASGTNATTSPKDTVDIITTL